MSPISSGSIAENDLQLKAFYGSSPTCMTWLAVFMCAAWHVCVAVCCSVLQCVAVCCSVLQCVAVCCSVLQCVAVCCTFHVCGVARVRHDWCVCVCVCVPWIAGVCAMNALFMCVAKNHVNDSWHKLCDGVRHYWLGCVLWIMYLCALPHSLQHTASHCNTLQHTATHCNSPQHTTTHRNTL